MPDDVVSDPGGAQVKAKRRRYLLPLLIVAPVVFGVTSGLTCAHLATVRERNRRMFCNNNLSLIDHALRLYAHSNSGRRPPTLGFLYPEDMPEPLVFLCRSAGKATSLRDEASYSRDTYTPAMFDNTHTDHVYVYGLRWDDPPDYIQLFEDEWNHAGEGVHVMTLRGPTKGRSCWWSDIRAIHEQLARQEKDLAAQGRKMKLLRPPWSSWPDPPAEARPWYAKRGGRALAFGAFAALAAALALIVRTVRRGRERRSKED